MPSEPSDEDPDFFLPGVEADDSPGPLPDDDLPDDDELPDGQADSDEDKMLPHAKKTCTCTDELSQPDRAAALAAMKEQLKAMPLDAQNKKLFDLMNGLYNHDAHEMRWVLCGRKVHRDCWAQMLSLGRGRVARILKAVAAGKMVHHSMADVVAQPTSGRLVHMTACRSSSLGCGLVLLSRLLKASIQMNR